MTSMTQARSAIPLWSDEGWYGRARPSPSPNADERPPGLPVELLVIHYISLPGGRFSGGAVEDLFLNRLDLGAHPSFGSLRGLRVSSHFFIRRDGACIQFVSGDRRAWHAGQSQFEDRTGCNDFSIGIELEGDGEHRFRPAQYARLARLTGHLLLRYPLRAVRGHSDIAPGRKQDPGQFFDWPLYAQALEHLSSVPGKNKFPGAALRRLAASARSRT